MMNNISAETEETDGVEVIVDENRIMWWNEKHIKENLKNKRNLPTIIRYHLH